MALSETEDKNTFLPEPCVMSEEQVVERRRKDVLLYVEFFSVRENIFTENKHFKKIKTKDMSKKYERKYKRKYERSYISPDRPFIFCNPAQVYSDM